ncbi:MAG: MBL fold metallo-hydrolase [Lachnospiraceae bacterium]|nr:MBL fold metallo-hydrolase [Candidatus Colinaster equi]
MRNSMNKLRLIVCAIIATVALGALAGGMQAHAATSKKGMEVHFIDVGQGDATLIKSGGEALLIDAGDNSVGTKVQLYLKKQGVTKLKAAIWTHPDADHIGGADVITTKYDIGTTYVSAATSDTATYNDLTDAMEYKNITPTVPKVGDSFTVGDAKVTFVGPTKKYTDDNNSSLVCLVECAGNKFLFDGDAEAKSEAAIAKKWGKDIDADVLKVGHHGSSSSTDRSFIKAVSPKYAVISCAEGNDYGHPHAETLNTLRSNNVELRRTDEEGSIVATCDSNGITWNCSPSTTWQAGEKQGTYKAEAEELAKQQAEAEALAMQQADNQAAQSDGTMVWLSATGEKYHSINNCGRMNPAKARQVTENEAIAQGYGKCSKCW